MLHCFDVHVSYTVKHLHLLQVFHVSRIVVVGNSFGMFLSPTQWLLLANPVCGCCCWALAPLLLLCCFSDETQIWLGDLRVVLVVCLGW